MKIAMGDFRPSGDHLQVSTIIGTLPERMFGIEGVELGEGGVVDDSTSGETKYFQWIGGSLQEMTQQDIQKADWQPLDAKPVVSVDQLEEDVPEGMTRFQLILLLNMVFIIIFIVVAFVLKRYKRSV